MATSTNEWVEVVPAHPGVQEAHVSNDADNTYDLWIHP
jgi:hypothetical protein